MERRSPEPEAWVASAVSRHWPDAVACTVNPLKGDASTRRFWRVTLQSPHDCPSTAIAVDLGPDDLPLYARALNLVPEPLAEPPWLNLHRFLTALGAPVPMLYETDLHARMLLVEDVGELPLFDAAAQGKTGDLYRLAADALLLLHVEGTRKLDETCIASRIAYDGRLFRWELEQFVEFGLARFAPALDGAHIAPELDELAARLDAYPRVFSHRDFHGHNLFVQTNSAGSPCLRIIDFQDALMAPAAQDLAVLLTTRDASRLITPSLERRVLDYYYAGLIRRGASVQSFDDFMASYRLCVLQHALKVIGRFSFIEQQGKSGYAAFLPYMLAQAQRMLALKPDFPRLRTALAA